MGRRMNALNSSTPLSYQEARQLALPAHRLHAGDAVTSDRSLRAEDFPALLAKAEQVFGGRKEAKRWFARRAMGLDGQRPRDLLQSSEGLEVLTDFLTRLEYGVYT